MPSGARLTTGRRTYSPKETKMNNKRRPITDRFWEKVESGPGCWNWMGAKSFGYGKFWTGEDSRSWAHRVSWELEHGLIPDGMSVDHICHSKACVKPAHLRLATKKQNAENLAAPYANSTTGERGVHLRRSGRYSVKVNHHGRAYRGGMYPTLEQAAAAARQLRNSLFTHNDLDRTKRSDAA